MSKIFQQLLVSFLPLPIAFVLDTTASVCCSNVVKLHLIWLVDGSVPTHDIVKMSDSL